MAKQQPAPAYSRAGRSFSIEHPHSCRHCEAITIDGPACTDAWARDQVSKDEASCSGALDSESFHPDAIRLHGTIQDVVNAALDGCAFFEYLGDLQIDGDEVPFEGADASDVVFCLVPRAYARSGFCFMVVAYKLNEAETVIGSSRQGHLGVWADEGTKSWGGVFFFWSAGSKYWTPNGRDCG